MIAHLGSKFPLYYCESKLSKKLTITMSSYSFTFNIDKAILERNNNANFTFNINLNQHASSSSSSVIPVCDNGVVAIASSSEPTCTSSSSANGLPVLSSPSIIHVCCGEDDIESDEAAMGEAAANTENDNREPSETRPKDNGRKTGVIERVPEGVVNIALYWESLGYNFIEDDITDDEEGDNDSASVVDGAQNAVIDPLIIDTVSNPVTCNDVPGGDEGSIDGENEADDSNSPSASYCPAIPNTLDIMDFNQQAKRFR